jgi:Tfp pilus assembly protein PilZ
VFLKFKLGIYYKISTFKLKGMIVMANKNDKGFVDRRRVPRKPCFFEDVDYTNLKDVYTDSVQNISEDGVFIETTEPLNVGSDLTMLFSDFSSIDLIKVKGDVVRKMPWGMGVKFNFANSEQSSSINTFVDKI